MTAPCNNGSEIIDRGNAPYVFDASKIVKENNNYRTAIWTGKHMQLTVMSIPVGADTGVEIHDGFEQMIIPVSGNGEIRMGRDAGMMETRGDLFHSTVAIIPSSSYHIIKNTGSEPLKLISVYAPPAHRFGTVHKVNPEA